MYYRRGPLPQMTAAGERLAHRLGRRNELAAQLQGSLIYP